MVKISAKVVGLVVAVVELCNRGLEQSVMSLMGKPIHYPAFALATPNCLWTQHTPRKKNQSWLGGDTNAISRLENNHPENGGSDSGHPPTAAQPIGAYEACGCKDSMQLESVQSRLRTLTSIGWMIFGFLVMKEANPTMPLWLRLSTGSVLSLLLTGLPRICEHLREHLWRSVSCGARMTPNESSSATREVKP